MVGDDDLVQSKHVNCFSLPSLVSRSSTRISQLISQIVQKRPKSGLSIGHSEVLTAVRIDSTDSIPIEPNQRKKYKSALLLSGSSFEHGHDSNCRQARPPHPIKILLNYFSVLTPLKVLQSAQFADRKYGFLTSSERSGPWYFDIFVRSGLDIL